MAPLMLKKVINDHLRLLQRGGELRDLAINVAILGKWPARAPIPIARVAEISFHDVHDTVCPTSELGFVLLHDRVRFLPLSFFEMTYRGSKCHAFPLCNQISSIDRQDDAGNKRRGGRTQKNSRGRDIVRLAPPPDRCACQDGAYHHRPLPHDRQESARKLLALIVPMPVGTPPRQRAWAADRPRHSRWSPMPQPRWRSALRQPHRRRRQFAPRTRRRSSRRHQ
jgi:hypothetical protein